MKDIESREDLLAVVTDFYDFLFQSDVLHHFFLKFKDSDVLDEHLQTLVDFWDNTLFYSGTYTKNAMKPHLLLSKRNPIRPEHFEEWITLFHRAVDGRFQGVNAETIKNRALSIATVMNLKITQE
ncbi:group III truncated hemoglobin [Lutimonas saemankumensis]|uniref:group III truncated hemoglobin n=1 Tax=Lutimonas saemankumensis TaxID=483016 RepID=UPI001CD62EC7|nr:group III truncated hemoglobin [Lutimonas saemankumensis]MCA0931103.1 group III truncated hemoglobin [Lutimonas saemankumensis]